MIKILIIAALLFVNRLDSLQAMELGDPLENQATQGVQQLRCYGYVNNKTLSLSKETVELVLDDRFNVELGSTIPTTNVKKFLYETVSSVVGMFDDQSTFYETLAARAEYGPLVVDVTVAGFNPANAPTVDKIQEASSAVYRPLQAGFVDEGSAFK